MRQPGLGCRFSARLAHALGRMTSHPSAFHFSRASGAARWGAFILTTAIDSFHITAFAAVPALIGARSPPLAVKTGCTAAHTASRQAGHHCNGEED